MRPAGRIVKVIFGIRHGHIMSESNRGLDNRLRWVVMALALGAAGARAQETNGWYAGIGVGSSHIEVYRDNWFGLGTWQEGPGDGTALLLGGYRFGDHVAIEATYVAETDLEWREAFTPVGGLPGLYDSTTVLSTSAMQLSALGILPFADIWDVYVRGGVSWYRADADQRIDDGFGGPTVTRSDHASGADMLLGVGIRASPREGWRVRLEYQFYSIDHALLNVDDGEPTVDTWFLGVDYSFGGTGTP